MFDTLENAKVGDKLFIEGTNVPARLDFVAEITKAGNIKTENGDIFTRDGNRRGNGNSFYRVRARVATVSDIEAVRRRTKINIIKAVKSWDNITDADLDTVFAIVRKYKVQPPAK